MTKAARVANARAAAQSYAPSPNGSAVTYGLVAAALVLSAAIVGGAFYRVDVLHDLWPIGLAMLAAFAGGAVLRAWRRDAHETAFSAEYNARSPAEVMPTTGQKMDGIAATEGHETEAATAATVTFHSPFLLPGLDRLHPAGTFEVRERREALDVSFDAAVVTRTIMLTGEGRIEALDVKADDLTAALAFDRSSAV